MSALAEVTPSLRPLVVAMAPGWYGYVGGGHGFTLHAASGQWHPVTDIEAIRGRVMSSGQAAQLLATYGRPVSP